ncbi:uncharacterized protein [Aegilops tauschii subsp. strangulata]|uniref:uncharacterized protein n=1 Tax=Aegilops tauschii subsp. strangulata TaxID=200361 RepID=UPI003CC85903
MDLTQVLPEEILADVLRRVAPTFSGRFDYVPHAGGTDWRKIKDHCNGLVLLGNNWDWEDCYVVNPATRQWDSLPPRTCILQPVNGFCKKITQDVVLSAANLYPSVFRKPSPQSGGFMQFTREPEDEAADPVILEEPESEWPPSLCALHVFSSKSGGWKERSFFQEGEAAATVSGMRGHFDWSDDRRHAVYCQGALYLHCKTDFVMRICLSNDKYQVIKPPMHHEPGEYRNFHLGRSEKGVYLATTTFGTSRLMVWVLEESCGHTNWVLKHNNCVTPIQDDLRPVLGPWVLQDINFGEYLKECKERNQHDENLEWLMEMKLELNSGKKELVEEKFEWDSENDNILHKEDMGDGRVSGYLDILGFHPYKEVVFLDVSKCRGLAYHLKDSKVQDLGYIYPTTCHLALGAARFITDSFPYTPCWTGLQKATRK